ncbi:MAG: glutamyl-tRNA reductase [Myxococcota bacterium]
MTRDILVVGLSHHTAPVGLRERLSVHTENTADELRSLMSQGTLQEGLLVSTCNRVELYATGDPTETTASIRKHLGHRAAPDDVSPHLYERSGREAIRHAFRVASSLDSMVVGEPQILGQVKQAYDSAAAVGAVGPLLGRCFTHAFGVAKRVRSETGVAAGSVSVSSIACDLARKIFGDLQGRRVLLVGAGKMGETAAKHLGKLGARLFVVNRSPERAEQLAEACGGQPRDYADLANELVSADVVITSTGSPRFIVGEELVSNVMRARKRRPLFLIDIAVPRDIDPRVGELGNIFLYDLDDLQKVADENLAARRREAEAAEHIVLAEVEDFDRWRQSLEVKPTVVALRERFRRVVRHELERTMPRLRNLDSGERRSLERMCEAVVNKLLHAPTTQLREGGDEGDTAVLVDAARRLFELHDEPSREEEPQTQETDQTAPSGVGRAATTASTGKTS